MAKILFALVATLAITAGVNLHAQPPKEEFPGQPAISVVPFSTKSPAVVRAPSSPVVLSGREFEMVTLTGAKSGDKVTWDVTTADGGPLPVMWFAAKPGQSVPGYRVGQSSPGVYDAPETPTVAVFANGSGKVVVTCWGVEDGVPKKLATIYVESSSEAKVSKAVVVDPLAKALHDAYAADKKNMHDADKDLPKMAQFYSGAASLVDDMQTWNQLNAVLQSVSKYSGLPRVITVLAQAEGQLYGSQLNRPIDKKAAKEYLSRTGGILSTIK